MTDCWKYRHISLSMETKNQGTDQQVSNVRETGDGGVDRCVCMHKDTLDTHTVFFKIERFDGLCFSLYIVSILQHELHVK